MNDYWNDLCNDLHGVTEAGNEPNSAMLWVLSMKTVLLSPTHTFYEGKNR